MNTITNEATKRSELLKALLEVQRKLTVANQERTFLLKRVAALENALHIPSTSLHHRLTATTLITSHQKTAKPEQQHT